MSYANVAANGSSPKPDQASETSRASSTSAPASTTENASSAPASEKNTAETTHDDDASPKAQSSSAAIATPNVCKKEKKPLAPAPVPAKSAWGASSTHTTPAVDEQKWPTPDKAPAVPVAQPANKAASKFIRPNKWVPINAKVVLPSPRSQTSGAGQQKSRRKNKANRKKVGPAAASEYSTHEASSVKNHEKAKGDSISDEGHETNETFKESDDAQHDQESTNLDQQDKKKTATVSSQNHPQSQSHKAGRKFNPQSGPVPNGKGHQGRQQQNGYYQSYGQTQGLNSNSNGQRPFRPNNSGQYRRNNSAGNLHNAYPNGYPAPMGMPFVPHIPHHPMPQGFMPGMPYGVPMPIQIPPPISPKQEPSQALTQQIDYYFSLENLLRDIFLRKHMGTEGWIDLDLILGFKRVKIITNGIMNAIETADEKEKADKLDKTILAAVQRCNNVEIGYLNGKDSNNATATEVQLRVKNNFEHWLLPDSIQV
ncbi:hypothetical protein ACI3LY_002024 [Candidozyma auris]|uniref:HTH La-type RNA-binding domain-containing protein n=1 Tax=Candidozyma auris TaxID=498019 RepID=A0A8F2VYV5_CANAR|nr:hypothetical protein QG37_03941 [[Candida] auris]QWW22419.1 hypothetical protein CA7LBN_001165 [[Candida] auris]